MEIKDGKDYILQIKELILEYYIGLYKKYGFEECEPYYNNSMDDVLYMKKIL